MRRKPYLIQFICVLWLSWTLSTFASAVVWTNTSGGVWSAAANWSPNRSPNSSDTASITTSGTYTIKVDVNVTNVSLTLGASSGVQTLTNNAQTMIFAEGLSVAGNGVFGLGGGILRGVTSIQGTVDWFGGTMASNITIQTGGILNLNANGQSLNAPLTNSGTVHWLGNPITVNNNQTSVTGAFYNLAGGTLEIQCDQSMYSGGYGFEKFSNAGLVQKTGTIGTTAFFIPFFNTGSNDVEGGTLTFAGGGTLDGGYNAVSGASINIASGTFTQAGPITMAGLGVCQQNGGTVTYTNRVPKLVLASGNVLLSSNFEGTGAIQDLQLDGAALLGTNTVTGFLGLNGGTIAAASPLTINSTGVLDFNGVSVSINAPVTNKGTIHWTGASININNNHGSVTGLIYNSSVGLFTIESDQGMFSGGYGSEFFRNNGLVEKIAGLGVTGFYLPVTNTGTFDAESGTIRFLQGGNVGGDYNAASGAVVEFNSGSFFQSSALSITGSGLCQLNGGTITLIGQIPGFSLTSGNVLLSSTFQTNGTIHALTLDGAYLYGTNTVTGTLNWSGGGLASGARLTVAPGGVVNLNGIGVTLNAPFINNGTVNWTGAGAINVNNNHGVDTGVFDNGPSGVVNMEMDATLASGGYGFEFVTNAGVFHKLGGLNNSTFQIALTNTGTLDAESGTIRLAGGGNLGGVYNAAAGAGIVLGSGTFYEDGAVSAPGAGLFVENGGNVVLNDQISNLLLQGGNVMLSPTFQGSGEIQSLRIDGATLLGVNRVAGELDFHGGAISPASPLTVLGGGSLELFGPGGLTINSPLTNYGTVDWWSGPLAVVNNNTSVTGDFINMPGALFDIFCDQTFSSGGYGYEMVKNAGVLRKDKGLGVTAFNLAFTNSGVMDAASGGSIQLPAAYGQNGGSLICEVNSLYSYGHFNFLGNAPLTGTFGLDFNGDYFPNPGDSFTFATYPSRSGIFTSVSFPTGTWLTNYGYTAFTATVTAASASGLRLAPIADRFIAPGGTILITNSLVDYNPALKITYKLNASPSGATISSTGVIQWQAPSLAIASSNFFSVTAKDNGSPSSSGTQTFAVMVEAPNSLSVTLLSLIAGKATIQVNGGAGLTNILQASSNLVDWVGIATNVPATAPFTVQDANAGKHPARYYRDVESQ